MDSLVSCLTDNTSVNKLIRSIPLMLFMLQTRLIMHTQGTCCISLSAVGEAWGSSFCTAELQIAVTGQWQGLKENSGLTAHIHGVGASAVLLLLQTETRGIFVFQSPIEKQPDESSAIQHQYWNLIIKIYSWSSNGNICEYVVSNPTICS